MSRSSHLVACLAAALVTGATGLRAQVNPAGDFTVAWVATAAPGDELTDVRVAIASARASASTLEYQIEFQRRPAAGEETTVAQQGLVTVRGGRTDSTDRLSVALAPGDRVEARLVLRHLQEGWELTDTLLQTFGVAPAPSSSIATDPDFLEIDGLVIDRVLTKSGRDFYEIFYRDWDPPLGASGYSVLVEENPFRGRQTLIKVSLDEQLLYQQVLQTRYDALEEMVQAAVAITGAVLAERTAAQRSRDGEASEYIESF